MVLARGQLRKRAVGDNGDQGTTQGWGGAEDFLPENKTYSLLLFSDRADRLNMT